MPPKMKLPKVQNIDFKKVKKNQEILDKKKIKVRKSKLEAPLRDEKLENPAKYIEDDTDYFIPPQLKKKKESAKYTDYDGYVNFIRGLFPPQYQEDPKGHHFYPDPHTDSTDGIKKEEDDMNVDKNFNTYSSDYFKQSQFNNVQNQFKASPFGFNSSNVSSFPDYNNFDDDEETKLGFDENDNLFEKKNSSKKKATPKPKKKKKLSSIDEEKGDIDNNFIGKKRKEPEDDTTFNIGSSTEKTKTSKKRKEPNDKKEPPIKLIKLEIPKIRKNKKTLDDRPFKKQKTKK